jgi:phage shock protein E
MKFKRFVPLALIVVVAIGCSNGSSAHSRINSQKAHELVMSGARLVDVRTAAEFSQKHVESAANIPVQELDGRAKELEPKDRPIVLYCRSGHRSSIAYDKLKQAGYTNVYDLGPMTAW